MKHVSLLLLTAGCALLSPSIRAADADRGKFVFNEWCLGCHAPLNRMGEQPAGTDALQQRYQGKEPAALEQRTDLNAAYIKIVVRNGLNVMPRTRKTEINDQDLDNVIAYLTRANH